jgi:hypothetical protein
MPEDRDQPPPDELDDTGQVGAPNPIGSAPLPPIGDPHRREVLEQQIEDHDPRSSAEESTDL